MSFLRVGELIQFLTHNYSGRAVVVESSLKVKVRSAFPLLIINNTTVLPLYHLLSLVYIYYFLFPINIFHSSSQRQYGAIQIIQQTDNGEQCLAILACKVVTLDSYAGPKTVEKVKILKYERACKHYVVRSKCYTSA